MSNLAPILLALFSGARSPRLLAKQGAFAVPIRKFSRIYHNCHASPISGVRIAAPIVLAQHQGNERIGKARTPVCRTLPIVIELAY
jgi:hypothetical protein